MKFQSIFTLTDEIYLFLLAKLTVQLCHLKLFMLFALNLIYDLLPRHFLVETIF